MRNFRVLVKQLFYANEIQFEVQSWENLIKDFLEINPIHIPFNFDLSLFYQEFICKKHSGKSLVKFIPTSKLEIEIHSHKKVVSLKLENFAHLFIVNFKRAKFQKN